MPNLRPPDPDTTPSPEPAGPARSTATATPPAAVAQRTPQQPQAPTRPPAGGGWATSAPLHGPWVDASLFSRRWPGPARPAAPAAVAAVGVAAVVAAVSVPPDRTGVGWLVAALAGAASLTVAGRLGRSPGVTGPAPLVNRRQSSRVVPTVGWATATVALLGVGTLRAAGWLFLLCLCTAVLTGTLAAAGGRSARAMLVAAGMAPLAPFRGLPWAADGLRDLHRRQPGRLSGARVAATVAVSVGLLVVFGALFASADATFARLLARIVPDVHVGTLVRWCLVGGVAGAVLLGAAFLRAAPPDLSGLADPGTRRVRRLEWAAPLSALVLLFAAFVAVQLTVLFGGGRHVLRTDGLTYAEYARGGFWQLLIVTGLPLIVLAGAVRWAPRRTRTDRVWIRVLLGALTCLTLLIVASALHRMNTYADTYGLTRLRLLVGLCELWLGVVFLLVLVAGIRLRAPWLPQLVVAAGVLALLGLAAANPDALIAERNVAHSQQTHRVDVRYLADLSPDAVPALDRLPAVERACALSMMGELWQPADDWRGWNTGRVRARRYLADHPVRRSMLNCPGWGD